VVIIATFTTDFIYPIIIGASKSEAMKTVRGEVPDAERSDVIEF
jgi:hypothetical protein